MAGNIAKEILYRFRAEDDGVQRMFIDVGRSSDAARDSVLSLAESLEKNTKGTKTAVNSLQKLGEAYGNVKKAADPAAMEAATNKTIASISKLPKAVKAVAVEATKNFNDMYKSLGAPGLATSMASNETPQALIKRIRAEHAAQSLTGYKADIEILKARKTANELGELMSAGWDKNKTQIVSLSLELDKLTRKANEYAAVIANLKIQGDKKITSGEEEISVEDPKYMSYLKYMDKPQDLEAYAAKLRSLRYEVLSVVTDPERSLTGSADILTKLEAVNAELNDVLLIKEKIETTTKKDALLMYKEEQVALEDIYKKKINAGKAMVYPAIEEKDSLERAKIKIELLKKEIALRTENRTAITAEEQQLRTSTIKSLKAQMEAAQKEYAGVAGGQRIGASSLPGAAIQQENLALIENIRYIKQRTAEQRRSTEARTPEQAAAYRLEVERVTKALKEQLAVYSAITKGQTFPRGQLGAFYSGDELKDLKNKVTLVTSVNEKLSKNRPVDMGFLNGLSGKNSTEINTFLQNLGKLGMLSPQFSRLSSVMTTLIGSASGATTVLTALSAVAAVGVAAGLAKITIEAAKAAAELQKYDVTIGALMQHGWDYADKSAAASQALGKAVTGGMLEYAADTGYALEGVANVTERIIGYGIDARQANDYVERLGNLALGSEKRLENLAIAFGQVFGQGKARAQEMYQFVNAGIPVFDLMAKKLTEATGKNVTTSDVMEMTRQGKMSFELIDEMLKELTDEGGRYNDILKEIMKGSAALQTSKFRSELKLLLADIGDNLLPTIMRALTGVNNALEKYRTSRATQEFRAAYENRGNFRKEDRLSIAFGGVSDREVVTLMGNAEFLRDAQYKGIGKDVAPAVKLQEMGTLFENFAAAKEAISFDFDKYFDTIANGTVEDVLALATKYGIKEKELEKALGTTNIQVSRGSFSSGLKAQTAVQDLFNKAVKDKFSDIFTAMFGFGPGASDVIGTITTAEDLYRYRESVGQLGGAKPGTRDEDTTNAFSLSGSALGKMRENLQEEAFKILSIYPIYQANQDSLSAYKSDVKAIAEARKQLDTIDKNNNAGKITKELDDFWYALTGAAYVDKGKGPAERLTEIEKKMKELARTATLTSEAVRLMGAIPSISALFESRSEGTGSFSQKEIEDAQAGLVDKFLTSDAEYQELLTGGKKEGAEKRKKEIEAQIKPLVALSAVLKDGNVDVKDFAEAMDGLLGVIEPSKGIVTLELAASSIDTLASSFGIASDKASELVNYIMRIESVTGKQSGVTQYISAFEQMFLGGRSMSKLKTAQAEHNALYNMSVFAGRGDYSAYDNTMLEAAGVRQRDKNIFSSGNGELETLKQQVVAARRALEDEAAKGTPNTATAQALEDVKKKYEAAADAEDIRAKAVESVYGVTAEGLKGQTAYQELIGRIAGTGAREEAIVKAAGIDGFTRDTFAKYGTSEGEDALSELIKSRTQVQDEADKGLVTEESLKRLKKAKDVFEGLNEAALSLQDIMSKVGDVFKDALGGFALDYMKDLGASIITGADAATVLGNALEDALGGILDNLPSILLQGALSMFLKGRPEIGLALLGAALGTSFISGIYDAATEASSTSNELKMLENLQAQMQTFMEQFKAGIVYVDEARKAYLSAQVAAGATSYFAQGGVTSGLQQGVYNQPTMFKFASGGVGMVSEFGQEEAALPLTRMSNGKLGVSAAYGGGFSMPITFIDNAGVAVDATVGKGTNGEAALNIVVNKLVPAAIRAGKADTAINNRFNVKYTGVSR